MQKQNTEEVNIDSDLSFTILNEETIHTGVIYDITNSVNDKHYIGQAKSYIQNHSNVRKHGVNGRFKIHCADAKSGSDSCAKLYPAMRKHGNDNFKSSLIAIVSLDDLNDAETHYIDEYNTIPNGYNIMRGGTFYPNDQHGNQNRIEKIQNTMKEKWQDPEYIAKTVPANLEATKKRAESGQFRKFNKDLPHNIYKTEKGYDIRIMRAGKHKITCVEGKDLTDEEKLKLAIIKRDKIIENMNNKVDDSHVKKLDHNGNQLPKGILCHKDKGSNGYMARIEHNKKTIRKHFIDSELTMDQKLELAKQALIDIHDTKDELINKKPDDRLDHKGNMLISGVRMVNKNGTSLGYSARYLNVSKSFCIKKESMDDKLKQANEHLVLMKKDNPQTNP